MAKRNHRATYSRDKKKGGYIIRIEGPTPAVFAGREVPVETKDGSEHMEELEHLIWSGNDAETGKPIALYSFKAKPKSEDEDEMPF